MIRSHRTFTLAAVGLLALSSSAMAGGRRVIVLGPPPVVVAPSQTTVYLSPVPTAYSETVVTRSPVGPTAYVEAAPVTVVAPARRVVTTTTTVVPARTVVTDPGLVPVGYEVVGPRRTKIVYPRRVYRYGY